MIEPVTNAKYALILLFLEEKKVSTVKMYLIMFYKYKGKYSLNR